MKNAILLASLAVFAVLAAASPELSPEESQHITVSAKPITAFSREDSSRNRFGALTFRGGLVLSSHHPRFGGISALRLQPDCSHFIALTDRAYWLIGRISYKENRPVGIMDAILSPVLNLKGKRPARWDTESLADDGRSLFVGLEGLNTIMRFDHGSNSIPARAQSVPVPPDLKSLPGNKGLEALVYVPKPLRLAGTLVAFSERGLDRDRNLRAFLIGGPTPGSFSVKRTEEFDISDAAILPDGDILILERKFFLFQGITIRIRRIRLADLKPGAVVDGTILLEADNHFEIDNLEALSANPLRDGGILLTLMSDDNFSPLQQTLLLQFVLAEK